MQITISTIFDSQDKSKTATFAIIAATLTGISVTSNPTKTAFVPGEGIDYSGIVVTASYSDGSTLDVTSECSITPSAGKAFNPSTDTNVAIVYKDKTASLTLTVAVATLTGISITSNPLKTCYVSGEHVNYKGMVVTATYSNGSAFDVASSCAFSPAQGETVSDTVTITYNDGTTTASCTLSLTVLSYSLVVETPPTKTTYTPGETVDYSGAVIKMVYSDGTEHDVTNFCSYTPVVDGETTTVTVSCAPAKEPFAETANGYVSNSPAWVFSSNTYTPTSIYQVTTGHKYFIAVGVMPNTSGKIDFDVSFTATDVSQATSDVSGKSIAYTTKSQNSGTVYTPTSDGYVNVRTYRSGQRCPNYLYDTDSENKTVTTSFTLTTQGV